MVTALYVTFGVIGGIIVFLVVLFVILSETQSRRQDRAQLWGAEYGVRQVYRARHKSKILMRIGAPECPDGRYSPLQLVLWKQYNQLDERDQELTEWERNEIVELRGYS